MKYLFLFVIICIQGCSNKPSHKFISKEEYTSYLNYKNDDWCKKYNCKNEVLKALNFNFKMETDLDLSNIEYEFLIIRQGVVYKGNFESKITINDICFCLDDELSKINTLAFVILDKTNKTAYKWYKKESFELYDKDSLSIVLQQNGNYSISL